VKGKKKLEKSVLEQSLNLCIIYLYTKFTPYNKTN